MMACSAQYSLVRSLADQTIISHYISKLNLPFGTMKKFLDRPFLFFSPLLGLLVLHAFLPGKVTAAEAAVEHCPALLNFNFKRLQDDVPQDLCQYAGNVVLVVNTASYCGYTGQYEGLEQLYAKYKDQGLVVLGFPSNDFSQEPGSNAEIADFCYNTYAVKFPMFSKSSVRGKDANPMYALLASISGASPTWNFFKYLIGRDGHLVSSLSSHTKPEDSVLVDAIEKALASR